MSVSKHRILLATGLPCILNWHHRRRLLVVTYHGLYDGSASAQRFPDTFVHIDQLKVQLRFLKQHYRVIRPDQLLNAIKTRTALPAHAALVTFDDAYANFKRLALPVLQKLDIQPIVFVPTLYVEEQVPFWYDLVWFYFRHTPRLHLDLLGRKLGPSAPPDAGDDMARCLAALKRMDRETRESAMQVIRDAVAESGDGLNIAATAADFLALTPDQVRELAGQGIAIGGHTHSHTILTSMPDAAAREEIRLNKSLLESWLDRPVHFFAYPNGGEDDFNGRHEQMLKDAGYAAAFSLTQARTCHLADTMSISRLHVAPEDTLDAFHLHCTGAAPLINGIRKFMARA